MFRLAAVLSGRSADGQTPCVGPAARTAAAVWWRLLIREPVSHPNQHALLIKGALLFTPNVVVTSVPFHLGHAAEGGQHQNSVALGATEG